MISTLLPYFLPRAYLRPWPALLDHEKRVWRETSNASEALLEPLIRAYITSQADLQTVQTMSGDMFSGGLSEPKYSVEGTAFNGEWGRPQRFEHSGPPSYV